MNQDQIGGIVRAVVPPLVAWIAAKGIIPASSVTGVDDALVAVIVTGAVAAWSYITNKTGKVIGGK